MNNTQQQFIKIIQQCEQKQQFIEFRALDQIQGSDVRFIEINANQFSYQDLLQLGFREDLLNLHQLITMDNQLSISLYLKQKFFHNQEHQSQFLLLCLSQGQIIIQVDKSYAMRSQLKLKLFPLSKMIDYLSDDKRQLKEKIALICQPPNNLFNELLDTNSHQYPACTLSTKGDISLAFYLYLIKYGQLADTQSFEIYPIFFEDNMDTRKLTTLYKSMLDWIEYQNQHNIIELFKIYHQVSNNTYLQTAIIQDIFVIACQKSNQLSDDEINEIVHYFDTVKLQDDYHKIVFYYLFQHQIQQYQKIHQIEFGKQTMFSPKQTLKARIAQFLLLLKSDIRPFPVRSR